MQTIPDPQKVNKCIGRRKEGPKRVLTSSEHSYIINHNRINAEKQTGRQTSGRTDTRPLLYPFCYGRSQRLGG